jgi:signal peptidase II
MSDGQPAQRPEATAAHLKRNAVRVFLSALGITLVVDQVTKTWAVRSLTPGRSIDLPLGVALVHARNTGVAFSKGDGVAAIIVPILLVIAVIGWTARKELRQPEGANKWAVLGYGLILGGAFGNVVDRLFRSKGWGRGAVVDMIDVGWWPIFNVADAALSIGVVLTLFTLMQTPRKGKTMKRSEPSNAQETS